MARVPTKQMFPKPTLPPSPALDGNIPISEADEGETKAMDAKEGAAGEAAEKKAPPFKKHAAKKKKMPVPSGKHSGLMKIHAGK